MTTAPAASSPPRSGSFRIESWGIWVAIIAGALGAMVGWWFFSDQLTPLSGFASVGTVTGISAGITAALATLIGLLLASAPRRGALAWMRSRAWFWLVLDWVGLIILHGAIVMLASLALFRLFQQSFVGLEVDAIAATAMIGIVVAAAGYFGLSSAARASTRSLSSLLAVFMASGIIAAMLLAENPYWWHAFFSELGTGQAGVLSFWTFNTTLTVSGLVLFTLANFISQDLRTYSDVRRSTGKRGGSIWMLRSGLMLIGACLVGISMVPININDPLHTLFTQILAAVCLLLFATIPIWFPGVPVVIYLFSYLMIGLSIFAVALWWPLGYYNLTGVELAMAGILFAWLVVLIRALNDANGYASDQPRPRANTPAGTYPETTPATTPAPAPADV